MEQRPELSEMLKNGKFQPPAAFTLNFFYLFYFFLVLNVTPWVAVVMIWQEFTSSTDPSAVDQADFAYGPA